MILSHTLQNSQDRFSKTNSYKAKVQSTQLRLDVWQRTEISVEYMYGESEREIFNPQIPQI